MQSSTQYNRMNTQHQKEKVHFQIEHIAFFSDALIAIAVTLLIIEIRAPKIESGSSFAQQMHQLQELVPEFISFIISFAIIISQWTRHHELFGNIINYDKKLITLNSLFLFTITIIPFSTSYFAHNNITEVSLPYFVYGLSLISLSVFNFLLFQHCIRKKNSLYIKTFTNQQIKLLYADYLIFPVSILAGLCMGSIDLKLGLLAYLLLMLYGFKINKKKNKMGL